MDASLTTLAFVSQRIKWRYCYWQDREFYRACTLPWVSCVSGYQPFRRFCSFMDMGIVQDITVCGIAQCTRDILQLGDVSPDECCAHTEEIARLRVHWKYCSWHQLLHQWDLNMQNCEGAMLVSQLVHIKENLGITKHKYRRMHAGSVMHGLITLSLLIRVTCDILFN